MRRTLAVLVTAGAFLVPAGAASAAEVHENASCSNAKGGNYDWTDHTYNGLGNVKRAAGCFTPTAGDGTDGTTPDPTVKVVDGVTPEPTGKPGWHKNHADTLPVLDDGSDAEPTLN